MSSPRFQCVLDDIALDLQLTKKTTRAVVERFIAAVPLAVHEHGRMRVPDLATFMVKQRKARSIALPGKSVQLPAHQVVVAKVAPSWRVVG